SPDGMIWIGSGNGLTRFDGKTFTVFTRNKDRLRSSRVADIFADRNGVLWLAGEDGVTRHDPANGLWATLPSEEITPWHNICSVVQDKSGDFWLGRQGDSPALTRYTPIRSRPPSPQVTVLADKEFSEHAASVELIAGHRATFKLNVFDLRTRGEIRRFRW